MPSLAYIFERFPAFTQTFCYREVTAMVQRENNIPIYSIRGMEGEVPSLAPEVKERIIYLPDHATMKKEMRALWKAEKLPPSAEQLFHYVNKKDWRREVEALWIGVRLIEAGITHVHTHFGGIGARVGFWLKYYFGISYSFTGHADDIFEETQFKVSLRDLIREAAFVVAVADYGLDWLKERFPEYSDKCFRVYNGIEIDVPPPTPKGKRLQKAHILSVGRLVEKKGLSDLVDACALLQARGVAFRCTIVGGGPLEQTLLQQIERLGLGGSVTLTGALPFSEVDPVFRDADIFTLPCIDCGDGMIDTLPTVIAEAMLHGLPVVSTRLAGIPEMMEDGVTGYLLKQGDSEALANALEELINDTALADTMGAAGYRLLCERFAISVTTEQLSDLINTFARKPSFQWNALWRAWSSKLVFRKG